MKGKNVSRRKYYIVYTLCFIVTIAVISIPFLKNGKTLIHYHDMLQQYFFTFEYYSDYLQTIVRTFFKSGKIVIPMWDYKIGMGADVLTSLNYYVIGDPLNLFSVFFKNSQLEAGFHLLLVIRIYLAGLFFSVYSRKIGYRTWNTLAAVYIYLFSIYMYYSVYMYSAFLNPFIYLPLILLGLEKILRKESPMIFIFSIFISLCSNFYFFYMIVILTVIYYLIRFFTTNKANNKKDKIKTLFQEGIKLTGFAVVGVLMSSCIFFPVLLAFFNQGREAYSNIGNLLYYSLPEYIQLASAFISPKVLSNYNLLGYCPIVFITVVLLFRTRNSISENDHAKALKTGFVSLSLLLLIPFFSSMMNGFSYSNNRWLFGYAFLMALITEFVLDNIDAYKDNDFLILTLCIIIYIGIMLAGGAYQNKETLIGITGLVVFWILFIVRKKWRTKTIVTICLCCCTCYGLYYYSSASGFDFSMLMNINSTKNISKDTAAGGVRKIEDDDFYRVDVSLGETKNEALVLNYYPTTFYYSLFPENIAIFNKELCNAQQPCANLQRGNNGRTYLNLLTNTKYLIADEHTQPIPYGYSKYKKVKYGTKKATIYKNNYSLPLAYTYDSYMDYDEYQQLGIEQKEEAMSQCAVLKNWNKTTLKKAAVKYDSQKLNYSIYKKKGLDIKDNTINVYRDNAQLCLKVTIPQNSETMVYLNNIVLNTSTIFDKFQISASCKKISSTCVMFQKTNKFYWGKDSVALSLGSKNSGEQIVKITFSSKGEYTVDDIQILSENMSGLSEKVNKLKEDAFNIKYFSDNDIKGNITVRNNKLLTFGIPYSTGWKVFVDGEEKELLEVNDTWLGVVLKKGNHNVELRYTTPGLKTGIITSGIGLLILVGYLVIDYRKRRKSVATGNYD